MPSLLRRLFLRQIQAQPFTNAKIAWVYDFCPWRRRPVKYAGRWCLIIMKVTVNQRRVPAWPHRPSRIIDFNLRHTMRRRIDPSGFANMKYFSRCRKRGRCPVIVADEQDLCARFGLMACSPDKSGMGSCYPGHNLDLLHRPLHIGKSKCRLAWLTGQEPEAWAGCGGDACQSHSGAADDAPVSWRCCSNGSRGSAAGKPLSARALERGEKDFLRQVFGIGHAPTEPEAEPVNPVAMPPVNLWKVGGCVRSQSRVLTR